MDGATPRAPTRPSREGAGTVVAESRSRPGIYSPTVPAPGPDVGALGVGLCICTKLFRTARTQRYRRPRHGNRFPLGAKGMELGAPDPFAPDRIGRQGEGSCELARIA